MSTVVIGIGNRWRRDDGAGPAVLDRLERYRPPEGARLVELDGEPARLVDAWTGAAVAIVVDAIRCDPPCPGRVRRIEVDGDTELGDDAPAVGGSHALGVASAAALGRALGRMPARLVVFGIEGADFGPGETISPPVAAAVDAVAARVAAEIEVAR